MGKHGLLLDRSTRRGGRIPGVVCAALGTAAAFAVAQLVGVVSALTVAVVAGIAVARWIPREAGEGLAWVTRRCLRAGVVLLGLQLGLGEIAELGPGVVAAVVVTVAVAFAGTLALARRLGVSRGLGLLVATGFSICGASAIAAMDSVTDNDKEDVATGVALVTLYGSAAIAAIPLLGGWLGLAPEQLGAWAGVSVHEVAQVVAAASPAGAAAVGVAVVVKLTRVVLLAPMVAGVSVWQRRRDSSRVEDSGVSGAGVSGAGRPPLIPLFVLGFLAMVGIRSTGILPDVVLETSELTTTLLFTAALFALGAGVDLRRLLSTGRKALLLGAVSTVLVAGVGLGALTAVGAG